MQSQSSRSKAGLGSRPMKECLTWIIANESKSTEDTICHLVNQRGGHLQWKPLSAGTKHVACLKLFAPSTQPQNNSVLLFIRSTKKVLFASDFLFDFDFNREETKIVGHKENGGGKSKLLTPLVNICVLG